MAQSTKSSHQEAHMLHQLHQNEDILDILKSEDDSSVNSSSFDSVVFEPDQQEKIAGIHKAYSVINFGNAWIM